MKDVYLRDLLEKSWGSLTMSEKAFVQANFRPIHRPQLLANKYNKGVGWEFKEQPSSWGEQEGDLGEGGSVPIPTMIRQTSEEEWRALEQRTLEFETGGPTNFQYDLNEMHDPEFFGPGRGGWNKAHNPLTPEHKIRLARWQNKFKAGRSKYFWEQVSPRSFSEEFTSNILGVGRKGSKYFLCALRFFNYEQSPA